MVSNRAKLFIVLSLSAIIFVSGCTQTTPQPEVTSNACSAGEKVYAKLNTTFGMMEVELYQNAAPKTVANFINLAESGFYNNLVWHRIVKGFVIQTGDPITVNGGGDKSLWGTGKSSRTVPLEICDSLHNNAEYLGMARSSDPNSGSSQFYINLADNTPLDGQYTVFGKVIGGMDVALAISNVPVDYQDQPIDLVFLTSVTISNNP